MKNPFKFGNRKARRAATKRGTPTLEELPDDLRGLVQTASMLNCCVDTMRGGTFTVPHAQVTACMEWLQLQRTASSKRVQEHPEFADYFPDDAAKLAQQNGQAAPALVDGNGQALG